MARRQITRVLEQQHQLREIARVRFGAPKGKNLPGAPLDLPRVTSHHRDVIEQVAAVYGGDVEPWAPDEKGGQQWQVTITEPRGLAIAVPPGVEPYSSAMEQWAGGINTVRCEGPGGLMQFRSKGRWVERACVCEERSRQAAEEGGEYASPCNLTTRLTFCILGIETLGRARVETKSWYAAQEVPAALAMLQASGRAGWIRMERRSRSVMEWDAKQGTDKPVTRRYPVIFVDVPFMVDEVMYLERPASMAALPAPALPALPRGARPQLGPGATVDPVGPQGTDRQAPPRAVDPVDLAPGAPVTGEVVDAAPEAVAPEGQQSVEEIGF